MKIAIQNLQKKIPIRAKKIEKLVLKVLQLEKIKTPGQLNFYFVNDDRIRQLNLRYRGTGRATDVLSFDLSLTADQLFADIVISAQTAVRNAGKFHVPPQQELCLYIIHGILHLLGYDDKAVKDKRIMGNRQRALLKTLENYASA